MSKINVTSIFKDHFATLVDENEQVVDSNDLDVHENQGHPKMHRPDLFVFILVPIGVASLLTWAFCEMEKETANTIITVLSIFVGLLINVIVLLFDLVKREERATSVKNRTLRQTLTNVAYTILVCIIGVIVTLLALFQYPYVSLLFTFLSYWFLVHIVTTLLMILKRMYRLFMNDLS